jgi:hypothetical protein
MLNPEAAVMSFKQQTELSLRDRCLTEYRGSELREVLERPLRVVFSASLPIARRSPRRDYQALSANSYSSGHA